MGGIMPRVSKRKVLPSGNVIVGFQILPDKWKELGKIAIDQDTSRTEILNQIITEYLRIEKEKEKAK